MKKVSPCMDCRDRAVGCHGRCERYKEWKGERDALLEVVNREKQKRDLATNYIRHNKRRIAKKMGRKGEHMK